MIVERTLYYSKSGLADRVLEIRRRACALRRAIGLASGKVMTRLPGQTDAPDVVWECHFHGTAEHRADLAARAASPAFEAVRAEMKSAIDGFERQVFEEDVAPLANGMRLVDLEDLAIVPREMTFQSAGRTLHGFLFLPPGQGPFPCLVCNHGSGIEPGSLDVSRPGTAARFLSWGIASFIPHRHGYGRSPGPAWRSEVSAEFGTDDYDSQLLARLDAESDDVIAALDFLLTVPEIDPRHIGVVGSSFGGINTLFAASKDARFTCAVDFAGGAMNWDRTPALRAAMLTAAAKIRVPLLLMQAANDYSVRPTLELVDSLKDHPQPVRSRIFPALGITAMEGHLLESTGALLWEREMHLFLERYL
jgi:dienelactone hydrolase